MMHEQTEDMVYYALFLAFIFALKSARYKASVFVCGGEVFRRYHFIK